MGLGLVTDLYELTMAASYLRRGMTERATFSLFVRELPPGRGFIVTAGLDDVLRALAEHRLDDDELAWLGDHGFDAEALDAFAALRFRGDVWAVPEGHVVFAGEPLLEVTAPLPEAQVVETLVLNQLTYQTVLATKAARCSLAAAGRAVLVDFSLRRTHGVEAGIAVARAAAIAGFAGTSNVAAAKHFGLTALGTMAHSFVQAFPFESDAFAAYAADYPNRTTFLVDTYDTLSGVEAAIETARRAGLTAGFGVRLDSGDLLALSRETRRLLDAAGYRDATIVASGGIDESEIDRLLDAGAPIDSFGIGTRLGVSADAPSLDTVYKLVEYAGRPVVKLSAGKESPPGPRQLYRRELGDGDVVATRSEPAPDGYAPMLVEVMRGGERVAEPESIDSIAARLAEDLASLPAAALDLADPTAVPVRVTARLDELSRALGTDEGTMSP